MSRRSKKFAAIGAATVTASALTAGAVPASKTDAAAVNRDVALTAATGPDYTQLITDSSNSLDNILIIFGNVGGAASGAWNPIASATGGLLPTFNAGTTQNDLTTLQGILDALTSATDVGVIPGLPPDATALVLANVLAGVNPALGGALGTIADTVLVPLGALTDVLADLNAISGIGGVPVLDDLLDSLGLTATQTVFTSGYDWPILGLTGSTTIGNTFVQIPSLTVSSLVDVILGGLTIDGLPVDLDALPVDITDALGPLLGIVDVATPSVTAWIPAGSGTYSLPLGGSVGWLATMPTVAIGPLDGLVESGLIDLDSLLEGLGVEDLAGIDLSADTVIAIPLFAAGATLPLGLASFGIVTTPGITFPTATGVSTIGGTTVMSFNILGFGFTNVNTLASTYAGTNGVNHNSGTNVLTLTTPLGPIPIPIVFSLGSFNAGTTGFGFTGPSLFGVGLLPPFQVGTAPTQQSPDGLIPAALLNAGLLVPTQLTDLSTLLGLPNPGDAVTPVLNPLFNTAVAPFGSQITDALNGSIGPLSNGFASGLAQLTGLLAQATGSIPTTGSGSSTPPTGSAANGLGGLLGLLGLGGSLPGLGSAAGLLNLDELNPILNASGAPSGAAAPLSTPSPTSLPNPFRRSVSLPTSGSQDARALVAPDSDADTDAPEAPKPRSRTLPNLITNTGISASAGNSTGSILGNGRQQSTTSATNARNQITDGLSNAVKALGDTVGSLGRHAKPDNDDAAGSLGGHATSDNGEASSSPRQRLRADRD